MKLVSVGLQCCSKTPQSPNLLDKAASIIWKIWGGKVYEKYAKETDQIGRRAVINILHAVGKESCGILFVLCTG